jgi:hypothetical protein
LGLGGSAITDAGVERLTELRQLEVLRFHDCLALTSTSVRHLRRFPNLTSLTVGGENITNAWLDEISSLINLEVVTIEGQKVTDDAVELLRAMKSLKRAHFCGTQVTQAEAARVQRTMNGCTIRVD